MANYATSIIHVLGNKALPKRLLKKLEASKDKLDSVEQKGNYVKILYALRKYGVEPIEEIASLQDDLVMKYSDEIDNYQSTTIYISKKGEWITVYKIEFNG